MGKGEPTFPSGVGERAKGKKDFSLKNNVHTALSAHYCRNIPESQSEWAQLSVSVLVLHDD